MKNLITTILLFISGCSGTTYLGQVGDTKFYSVNSSKWDGPNFNALISLDSDHKIVVQQIIGGSGIGPSLGAPIVTSTGVILSQQKVTKSPGITIENNK